MKYKIHLLLIFAGCTIASSLCTCSTTQTPPAKPLERAWEAPTHTPKPQPEAKPIPAPQKTQADNPPATKGIIAVVDGSTITRSEMLDLLIESQGLRLLEQLILLHAAQKKAADMSLTITQNDIEAAHQDAIQRLSTPLIDPEAQPIDRQTAQRLLQQFLSAKNISPHEWQLRLKQRAYLHKIAEAQVDQTKITEDMLRNQFQLTYGQKVRIRHIQLASLAEAARARAMLTEKKDFAAVARQYSRNQFTAIHGGLTPPFTKNDPSVTPLIREKAFNMKPGQISPALQEGNTYHIIKLEKRI
ncbi:MAG: peptidylprolyl isomerase, partial [Planctomycetota bacterium]